MGEPENPRTTVAARQDKAASGRLSLRRETVRVLGVRAGIKTGVACGKSCGRSACGMSLCAATSCGLTHIST